MEAEKFGGTGDQLTIKTGADQDGNPQVAEAVCADQQAAMPESEYYRPSDGMTGDNTRLGAVLIAESEAEQPDQQGGCGRNDSEGESLEERQLRF